MAEQRLLDARERILTELVSRIPTGNTQQVKDLATAYAILDDRVRLNG